MAQSLTHAGAVAFRERGAEIFYLIVSSSDGANWVLPKGHIDSGETSEIAALRELAEEAGVLGTIVDRLSVREFKKRGKEAVLQYFLVREAGSTATKEKRILRWEHERTALELLSFEEARLALLEGAALVHRHCSAGTEHS
ncbi:MAG TPA: NUDIX domain-containing protein [Pyrinomonadaceae bacterium]|nr:NUDIX domain-containing protein [Pyrinomonadaceae bacterium]